MRFRHRGFIAGPLLAARFNIERAASRLYVVRRFHILPALLAIPIASTLDFGAPGSPTVARQRARLRHARDHGPALAQALLATGRPCSSTAASPACWPPRLATRSVC